MNEGTASTDAVSDAVREYILAEFLPGTRPSELTDMTPLVSGGILDSIATVKLVTFLEHLYGIEIQAHEASIDYLDTIRDITRLVRSKV